MEESNTEVVWEWVNRKESANKDNIIKILSVCHDEKSVQIKVDVRGRRIPVSSSCKV